MATRIVGVKRPLLDLNGLNDALPTTMASGHHHQHIDNCYEAAKRARQVIAEAKQSAGIPAGARRDNTFPMKEPLLESELEEILVSLDPLPAKKLQNCGVVAAAGGSAVSRREEQKYTLDDVKIIVNKAVAQRESILREEYERILAEKLNEQFRQFTQHNQDYVARLAKGNALSYVS